MKKKSTNYFVSYQFNTRAGASGFGNATLTIEGAKKVSDATLVTMKEFIANQLVTVHKQPVAADGIIILYFHKLEDN